MDAFTLDAFEKVRDGSLANIPEDSDVEVAGREVEASTCTPDHLNSCLGPHTLYSSHHSGCSIVPGFSFLECGS